MHGETFQQHQNCYLRLKQIDEKEMMKRIRNEQITIKHAFHSLSDNDFIQFIYKRNDILRAKDLEFFKDNLDVIACSSTTNCMQFCCFDYIQVSEYEFRAIKHYIKKQKIKIDQKRLEKLACVASRFFDLDQEDRKCIFLDENRRCSIYEVRPLVCRNHFVNSEAPCRCFKAQAQLLAFLDVFELMTAYFLMFEKYSLFKLLRK